MAESLAQVIRQNLSSSLLIADKLTINPQSAAELMLNNMNAVLREVVDSNFGLSSLDSIGSLYEAIDRNQKEMIFESKNVQLFYFTNSFAVVMEQAVLQLQQRRQEDTVSSRSPLPYSETSWNDETSREAKKGNDEGVESDLLNPSTTPTSDSRGCSIHRNDSSDESPPSLSPLSPPSESRPDSRVESTASICTTPRSTPAAVEDRLLSGSAAWRIEMQRKHRPITLDFSLETLKGRIIFYDLPRGVFAHEIRSLLEPFGPILEFYFKAAKGNNNTGFVLIKLENDCAAYKAIASLNGTMMCGARMKLKKMKYCMNFPNQMPSLSILQQQQQLRQLNTQVQPKQKLQLKEQSDSCSEEDSAAAQVVASAEVPVDHVGEAKGDSDDESEEELSDDLSYHSMFSVD